MNNAGKISRWIKYMPLAVLTLIGAAGGYLYYRYVGCSSGMCAISSNPYISTIYGGIIGALIGSVIAPQEEKKDKEENVNG